MENLKYLARKLSYIVPIGLTISDRVVTIAQVDGESMQPTFNPKSNDKHGNDIVLINRWSAHNFEFKPGDIIEIKSPKNAKQRLIKRIIALEGEWIQPRRSFKDDLIEIPIGHCWIEGDNHQRSNDSNHFGAVPLGLVRGTISYIIWPPSRWSKVESNLGPDAIKRRSADGLDMYGLPGSKGIVSSPPQQPWIRFNDSPTPSTSPQSITNQQQQKVFNQQQHQSKISSSSPGLAAEIFSPPDNCNNASNGMQPANFDFDAASIERDPKILHPVALRVSPEGQLITYDSNDGIGSSGSSSLFLKSLPITSSSTTTTAPTPSTLHSAAQQESSTSSAHSTIQSFQPFTGKKDLLLAPPPPPRPHRRQGHARSSSLDLNALERSLPSASANHGRKLIPSCSNSSSNNAFGLAHFPPGIDKKGAFTVYRKLDQHTIKEATKETNRWLDVLKAKYQPPKPVQMPRSIYELFQNSDLVDYIQDLKERCYRLEMINNELIHEMANLLEEKSYDGDPQQQLH